ANVAHLDVAETIAGNWVNTANPWADNEVADTLTASLFVGSGSTTTAIDLATAEVAGVLPNANVADDITASNYLPLAGGNLTGNVTADAGITVDGVDIGAHAAATAAHGATGAVVGTTNAQTLSNKTLDSTVMSNDATLGQAAGPLLAFDDTNNYLEITGANVGIGTTAPGAKLHVVGSADATQVIVTANATQGNANPLIKAVKSDGTTELFRLHSDNATNLFLGTNAGRVNNVSGVGNEGLYNTFLGSNAGYANTTGYRNTAHGYRALFYNTTGVQNTPSGYQALDSNTTGSYNTASGRGALSANTTG
ncbi:MAG: hypothetical protein AAB289_04600, partial [Chloroflexota bacterium]